MTPTDEAASQTPRTDAAERPRGSPFGCVDTAFARQLERELIAAQAQIAALKNDIVLQRNGYTGMVDALEAKRRDDVRKCVAVCEAAITNHGKRIGGSDTADSARRNCIERIRAAFPEDFKDES